MADNEIGKIDENMAYLPANGDGIAWHLPYEAPMRLLGLDRKSVV